MDMRRGRVVLGRRDPQVGLFGARNLLSRDAVSKSPFYAALAEKWRSVFRDDDFTTIYSEVGRPSVPPSVLAVATLLQYHERISDAEVVERTRWDLRWKLVFDRDPLCLQALFAKSTYQAFRARLALHEQEALAFQKSIEEAKRAGLLAHRLRVALDSSPVNGAAAVTDTYNLLSAAIAKIVRTVAKGTGTTPLEVARRASVEDHLATGSVKGRAVLDWDDPQQVKDFLGKLLAACRRAIGVAEDAGCASDETALLRTIIAQNVAETQDGAEIAQGVAKGRVVSVQDPEMRHGRKSSGRRYDGHKAHVAVDVESGILTAIEMDAPGIADGAHVGPLLEQTERRTGSQVDLGIGDCAYSSRLAIEQATAAGTEILSKMPSPPKGRFGPGDFEVSDDGETAG